MGRPLNKKYFGNRNVGGTGGEGVASVTNPAGDLDDLEIGSYVIPESGISAPQIVGGSKPVLTAVVTGATAYTITVTSAGSGYTSAPAITFNGSVAGGTGSATPVATLTTTTQNAFTISAFVPGGSSAVVGDIIKQVGANMYRVATQQGSGLCKLVAAAPAAGEMTLTATDSAGGTYYVTKLTARRAFIVKGNRTGTQFAAAATGGVWVRWNLDAAVLNESVVIASV